MSRFSVLSGVSACNVKSEPYPHIVVHNAIDATLFKQLEREFPSSELLLGDRVIEDKTYEYSVCKIVSNPAISPIWREFVAYHSSREFFMEVLRVFGDAIVTLHQRLEHILGKSLRELSTGIRNLEFRRKRAQYEVDLAMECQFYLNYTRRLRQIVPPHVDRGTQLYGGMLYFREEADDSSGGDFQICEPRDYRKLLVSEDALNEAELDNSRVTDVVKYESNTLVFFLNSVRSIHAVSPRSATPFVRRHVNICADLLTLPGDGLFNVCRPAKRSDVDGSHPQGERYEIVHFRLPDT